MIIVLENIINSFLEALLIINVVNACVKKECKKNKKQLLILVFIFSILTTVSGIYFYEDINVIINGFIYMIIIGIAYRLDFKKVEIISNSMYVLVCILSIIIMGIFYPYLQMLNLEKVNTIKMMNIIMFTFKYISLYILFKSKKYIIRFFRFMIKEKIFLFIIIMINFVICYSIIMKNSIIDFDKPLLKNIVVINLFLFLIINSLYFSSIKKECSHIKLLNEKLESNNSDLRKIKHDYGAEISYLYGLYLMNKKEKLGEALENIIENNNKVKCNIEINKNGNKQISQILKSSIDLDIPVIIDENLDMNLIKISDEDLSIILNNIITSVIENKMFVSVKTYTVLDKLIINIKCNIKDLIGRKKLNLFSNNIKIDKTKVDLAETLLEKNNGSLYVNNLFYSSEFEITLPLS